MCKDKWIKVSEQNIAAPTITKTRFTLVIGTHTFLIYVLSAIRVLYDNMYPKLVEWCWGDINKQKMQLPHYVKGFVFHDILFILCTMFFGLKIAAYNMYIMRTYIQTNASGNNGAYIPLHISDHVELQDTWHMSTAKY